jgi:DNA-3-methyladenine glycosylase II
MARPATRAAWAGAANELADRHPVAMQLLERHGPPRLRRGAGSSRRFEALASSIAYQQLAGRAAASIWARVLATVGTPFTPERVIDTGAEPLRRAGLSAAKAAALLDLAGKCAGGVVRLDRVTRMDDDAVVDHLTVVRGVGPWTAQMFLLFELGRLDVWPVGDYGVRTGFARAFSLGHTPTERGLSELGRPFEPFRSVMAWWCWREVDTPARSPG